MPGLLLPARPSTSGGLGRRRAAALIAGAILALAPRAGAGAQAATDAAALETARTGAEAARRGAEHRLGAAAPAVCGLHPLQRHDAVRFPAAADAGYRCAP